MERQGRWSLVKPSLQNPLCVVTTGEQPNLQGHAFTTSLQMMVIDLTATMLCYCYLQKWTEITGLIICWGIDVSEDMLSSLFGMKDLFNISSVWVSSRHFTWHVYEYGINIKYTCDHARYRQFMNYFYLEANLNFWPMRKQYVLSLFAKVF